MSNPNQTRNIPAMHVRAAFEPTSLNEEKRTIDITWTTGARVRRFSWWDGEYDEELSTDPAHVRMDRLTSGRAPFLTDHNGRTVDAVVGVIESARLDKGQGTATVRFVKDDPDADRVWNKIRQGILPNVSVGYRTWKSEKVEQGSGTVPVWRAVDWEPHEISTIAIPAENGAHVRSDDPTHNPCEFVFTRGAEPQKESRTMAEQTNTSAPTEGTGQRSAAPLAPVVNEAEIKQRAIAEERERVAGINLAVRAAGLDEAFGAKLVADNVPVDQARAQVLEALRKRQEETHIDGHQSVQVIDAAEDKSRRGMEAWILEKSGALEMVQRAEKSDAYMRKLTARGLGKADVGAGEFRGASLADLARRFLESRGVRPKTFDKAELFRQAFNYRAGYATTGDFPVLFESVLYKTMLAAYETQGDVWSRFCGTKEVQDFRPANFFRTGSFGALPALNEHGEFEQTAIPDGAKSSISIGTYGDIIAISRQAVINDDMGALTDIAAQRGRDARVTIEDLVFSMLAQNSGLGPTVGGTIFFSATNGNINSTAAANTAASWDLDAQVMSSQMDHSGKKRLDLQPEVLLLPRAKKLEAQVLNASTVKVGGTNGEPNPAAGAAKDIIATPRLSGTRRYWFANPKQNPAIVVGFLAGQGSAPALSSEEGFSTDGTRFRTRLDFGVAFFDPKCAVTNPGA